MNFLFFLLFYLSLSLSSLEYLAGEGYGEKNWGVRALDVFTIINV